MAAATYGNIPIACSCGLGTGTLVIPPSKVRVCGGFAATINDSAPFANITPCGMCVAPANPQVAALIPVPPPGAIKPVPCVPRLQGNPWVGCASKVRWGGKMALTNDGSVTCQYGGVITVVPLGKPKVNI